MKSSHKFHALSAALVLAATLSGCQYDPYYDVYTNQKPAQSDIVGTYILTSQTLSADRSDPPNLVANDGATATSHTIKLNADGTWKATNFPIWAGNWANKTDEWSINKFVNGTGKWSLEVVGSVDKSDIWGLRLTSRTIPTPFTPEFGNQKPPYSLILGYGDPDEGNKMFYERISK